MIHYRMGRLTATFAYASKGVGAGSRDGRRKINGFISFEKDIVKPTRGRPVVFVHLKSSRNRDFGAANKEGRWMGGFGRAT